MKSADDLELVKDAFLKRLHNYKYRVLVCSGGGCVSANCHAVKNALLQAIKDNGIEDQVLVSETGCIGTCNLGPVMAVMPEEVFYTKLTPADIPAIVKSHLVDGNICQENTYYDIALQKRVSRLKDIEFFKNQVKIALRNCGSIDYSSIEEYIANDGYMAAAKALGEMTRQQVIEEVTNSGLRGRGGAGFPTGIKWKAGYEADGDEKYIVCNADEGDPGAFMDRSIIEGDPHSIIEGLMIGAYAIGAKKGFAYIRAEYPLAIERFNAALAQAREMGILGENIFSSGFNFDIEVRIGAGAFVCGEETALMASVEGGRGEPRQKPPFPFQKGLLGKPTIINNVETLANIPPIIFKGSQWYAGFGTEKSKGTKVFALAGDINNTGLVEVPIGMPLRDIVYGIGGGIPGGREYKAAQIGGPSGGCIPKEHLDTPVDYDSLTKLGAIMGSGGLIIMDEDKCMVDVAKYFMDFVQNESCGKCIPCRLGTKRMKQILEKITDGKGTPEDIDELEAIARDVTATALCGLGQTASNPILSTLRSFRNEYEEHVTDKKCATGKCKELVSYRVLAEICKKCGLCAKNCPATAITGSKEEPYEIDESKCIKCGICLEKCPFEAISTN
ncbi:MAG: NADH-quinone oxidoreductase subunit NuoF [Clostridiales bacterium]|nr:NADH-quinone oxidoreductase subunit NuoF [Clostridiales bacterium]